MALSKESSGSAFGMSSKNRTIPAILYLRDNYYQNILYSNTAEIGL